MPVIEEKKSKLKRALDIAEGLPCIILVACGIYILMFRREAHIKKEIRRKKCQKRI